MDFDFSLLYIYRSIKTSNFINMKKALKIIGIIILIIVVVPLIVALFVSKDFNFETSVTINAPIDSVWTHTNSLAGMDRWDPWDEMDSAIKKERGGMDGEVGSWQSWKSESKDVGHGKQTITNLKAPELIETYLEFYEPYESEAQGYVSLKTEGNKTVATWGFKSEMPYPFNLMKLTLNEDDMKIPFDKGLNKLKALSEAMMVVKAIEEIKE